MLILLTQFSWLRSLGSLEQRLEHGVALTVELFFLFEHTQELSTCFVVFTGKASIK